MTTQFAFRGCLFDLDGTLLDSSLAVHRAWGALLARNGLDPDTYFPRLHGRPAHESIREFLASADEETIQQEIHQLHEQECTDTDGIVPIDGAIAFLAELDSKKIPWAIVTSGTVAIASARIKAAGIPSPSVLITADDISRGKPHPEPYLKGAKGIMVDPQDCLVFEDAPAGLASGQAAGCHVIGIAATPSSSGQEAFPSILSYSQLKIEAGEEGFLISLD
ncbi:HAD-IA family hydrolase [uncultured Cohaesibacter sp.]|uniref:HAD-IA family hydrolase n=1 Tax=uncultured Cohaesibacter sp. TaxID=1002546 RepID=UPI0029C90751|nr:HAD-IA family hydrolase [uncultured Cohaesibacter sp.]